MKARKSVNSICTNSGLPLIKLNEVYDQSTKYVFNFLLQSIICLIELVCISQF